ncbi:MAG TPA: hypothetical protein VKU80_14995, partial [Planctomycetota bacterium]|nr:hypothetical protein [Planctomycetota bacterium]
AKQQPSSADGGLDPETKRRAAAVLEVLGGARTPTEAAQVLGLTNARYYQLEARALEALIAACDPQPTGRSGRRILTDLQKEVDRLRNDLTRSQALVRAMQRAAGLPLKEGAKEPSPKKMRTRARALRTAGRLVSVSTLDDGEPVTVIDGRGSMP